MNLVNERIGAETPEKGYFETIKDIFKIPTWVGMMGGKRNKALYFVGYQGDNLLFLDPHYEQEALRLTEGMESKNLDISTYTCTQPKLLDMTQLDTWLGIGFLVKNSEDFSQLKTQLKKLTTKHKEFSLVSFH